MFGKKLQQAGIRYTAIQNDDGPNPFFKRHKRGFGLRDHTAGNLPVGDHVADLIGAKLGDNLSRAVLDTGDIGQQQQPVSP